MSEPDDRGNISSPTFGLVLRTLERVEDKLSEFAVKFDEKFDNLSVRFVPRSEITSMQATADAQRLAIANELNRVAERLEKVEEMRRDDRRFALTSAWSLGGLALMALGTLVTLLIFILNHK